MKLPNLPFNIKIGSNKKKTVVLEFTSGWLKLAQAETGSKGVVRITKLAAKKIVLIDEVVIRELLKFLQECGVKASSYIICISRNFVSTRNLELPSTNPEEIKEMIGLQVGKYTPYSKEEILTDYRVIDGGRQGYTKIILVIARQNVVNENIKLLRDAKLKIEEVFLSSDGIINWFNIADEGFAGEGKNEPVAVIDVDYAFSELEVILGKNLIFTRSIAIGSEHIMEEGELRKFIDAVKRLLIVYQNEEMNNTVRRIVLTGADANLENLSEALKKEFDIPVEVMNPFQNISIEEETIVSMRFFARDISFTSVLGAVLRSEDMKVSLLPEDLKISRTLEERGKDVTVMGIFLVLFLILISGIVFEKISNKKYYISFLDSKLEATQKEAEKIEKMMMKMKLIKDRLNMDNSSINLFHEVYRVVPNEIYLTDVNFEEEKQIILKGTAQEMSAVFRFVTTLESLPLFENVKTKYATKRRRRNKELTDFEIICPFVK